ncbi:MAG: phosphoserine phosphatase SerB [Bacteriovoracia bacterium]
MKKYVLCCVSTKTISKEFLDEVLSHLQQKNVAVERTEQLTEQGLLALDIHLVFSHHAEEMKVDLMDLSNKHRVDMALIPKEARHNRKLIIFDMDSTLIQHEVIDEMAMAFGIGDKVKAITERAMNGELNFDQSLTERVSLLKGLQRKDLEEVLSKLRLTSGVERLITEVKKKGYKTAIVSGGFMLFAEHFRQRLGMDYAFANDLEWEGDALTGKVKGRILNAEEKARILEDLARKENVSLDQVVAVGDGANDLPMLAKAGFGIAFHAKEKVRREATHRLSFGPMTSLLYFLGIPGNHLDEVI